MSARSPVLRIALLAGVGLAALGCSRTSVGVAEREGLDAGVTARMDASRPPPLRDAGPDAPEVPIVPCTPALETCNGTDDDCNGAVDDMAPVPCEGGGASFCVAGRMSACPRRCDVCVPGSTRECFTTLCTYWGTETCTADGRSFGRCREGDVAPGCEDVAQRSHDSPALEQCCIDRGLCCRDQFDLDGDGDRRESVGTCDGASCE